MNLDLHKELYFFEWGRKEQLAIATNLPVALLTVLGGRKERAAAEFVSAGEET